MAIRGLHHVTAITGDPQTNIDFYTGILGLRLVKVTVNFDDPGTYHLYYGDELGRPGSILTFFAWPGAFAGRSGTSQITAVAMSIPKGSVDYWNQRLSSAGVHSEGPFERFSEKVLRFEDPDGLELELIEPERGESRPAWTGSPVPVEHSIRGFHSITISQEHAETTAGILIETLDFHRVTNEGNRFRYETAEGGPGATVDVLHMPGTLPGTMGAGAVHHVAWRTPDDCEQAEWRARLLRTDISVTPVRDRVYFHSIYFREPGGVLFEIATDEPGFAIDEPVEQLGSHLQLPPWLEPLRVRLEHVLPEVHLPAAQVGAGEPNRRDTRRGTGHEYG